MGVALAVSTPITVYIIVRSLHFEYAYISTDSPEEVCSTRLLCNLTLRHQLGQCITETVAEDEEFLKFVSPLILYSKR